MLTHYRKGLAAMRLLASRREFWREARGLARLTFFLFVIGALAVLAGEVLSVLAQPGLALASMLSAIAVATVALALLRRELRQ
jgi:hypothetical protein